MIRDIMLRGAVYTYSGAAPARGALPHVYLGLLDACMDGWLPRCMLQARSCWWTAGEPLQAEEPQMSLAR